MSLPGSSPSAMFTHFLIWNVYTDKRAISSISTHVHPISSFMIQTSLGNCLNHMSLELRVSYFRLSHRNEAVVHAYLISFVS